MNLKINQKFKKFTTFNNVFKLKLLNRKPKINKPLPPIPTLQSHIENRMLPLVLPPPILELPPFSPLVLPNFSYQPLSSKLVSDFQEDFQEEYKRPILNSIYTNDDDSIKSCDTCDTLDTCDTFVKCNLCVHKNTKNTKKYWNDKDNIISWIETSEDDIMFSNFFTPLSPNDKFAEVEFFASYIN
jgi:hypothetical protein